MSGPSGQDNRIWRIIWLRLEHAGVYAGFRRLVGAKDFFRAYVRDWIRPGTAARVLDIGCGTADILELLPAGITYVGFDLNEDYLAVARRRYGSRGEFIRATVAETQVGTFGRFDVVMANGLLHHLDNAGVERVVQIAAAALRPGGRFITLDGVLTPKQSRLARFFVQHDRGRFVRDEAGYRQLLESGFARVQTRILTEGIRLPYSFIIMEAVADESPGGKRFVRTEGIR